MSLSPIVQYAESHFADSIEKLKTLIRIPSVSFEGFPLQPLKDSARAIAELLKTEGLENVEILEIEGAHPYIYGDWLHAPGKPTLLLYAHHDVQPPGREEIWDTPPFEPVEKKGRLFARGSADDKAGIVIHTSAISAFLKTQKKLPVNIKFLIEGEEEIGSGHLEQFLKKYQSRFKADAMVLTDTGNYDTGIPTITTSLRGIVANEIEVRTSKLPLHSGSWGGPGPDPVIALAKMLAPLVDAEGRINIPGIYEDVRPTTPEEDAFYKELNYSDDDYARQAGLKSGVSVIGGPFPALKKMSRLPSIAVNAIQASSRKNASNIVNDIAWCKVGIRTVPDMNPAKTEEQLQSFLRAQAPWGVEVSFKTETHAPWWITTPDHPAFKKARESLTRAFGRDCVLIGQGGSIPFVEPFAKVLGGVPALLIGIEDPYTNAHAENESLDLGDFRKAIEGAIYFYESMAE